MFDIKGFRKWKPCSDEKFTDIACKYLEKLQQNNIFSLSDLLSSRLASDYVEFPRYVWVLRLYELYERSLEVEKNENKRD